ncbi:transferase [Xylariaceae sp. FL0804]|nr:transferase [Xylariaceae sp. FL0804]
MPKRETFHLRPTGWEDDPAEERLKVSTLDCLAPLSYNNYMVFFRLADDDNDDGDDKDAAAKPRAAVALLRAGLERTLSQARHYCGTIERDDDEEGGYSFVKRRDSTVKLVVQWLDHDHDHDHDEGNEDEDNKDKAPPPPSFDDLERAHFRGLALGGDLGRWSVAPMTYGEKPSARPSARPALSAFQANLVRGGLLAENCRALAALAAAGGTTNPDNASGSGSGSGSGSTAADLPVIFPPWDPSCLDVSRLCKPEPRDEAARVDGPPAPPRHPDHDRGVALLFHLPRRRAAALKRLATPPSAPPPDGENDGGKGGGAAKAAPSWISTYDAFSAFLWRALTRLRAPVFAAPRDGHLFWGEAIDMRRRLHSPRVPARVQQNVMFAATSDTADVARPTVAEIISEAPLWRLASQSTTVTHANTIGGRPRESLDATLAAIAPIRDKSALSLRIDARPPLSILMTDHRDAGVAGLDFGLVGGLRLRPAAYRHVQDAVTEGVVIVYPPRARAPSSSSSAPEKIEEGDDDDDGDVDDDDDVDDGDEGPEFVIFYEARLAQALIDDEEFAEYFEYRGVDGEDRRR